MNMSFFKTQEQFKKRTKTVTRRLGWANIKLGVVHQGIVKGQGIPKGDKIQTLGNFIPVDSRWETLNTLIKDPGYGWQEVIEEGFPDMAPAEFVEMFCDMNKCLADVSVNRIKFSYTNLNVGFDTHLFIS